MVLQKIAVNEKAGTVGAPQPVIGATAQAAPNGELKATVSFVMPSKDLTGTDIPAYENLTATIKSMSGQSVTETKTVTGKAASTQTLDINTAQGDNTIEITVAAGQNVSDPATIDVYTGVVKPMRVQGLTATVPEDNMSMTLTWQAPIAGENNGYCNFDDLDYDIYMRDAAGDYKYHTTVGKAKTYTHTMQPGARLASVALRVLPRNAAGTSTDVGNYTYEPPCYVTETLGVPHAMPATETFDNQEIKYTPVQNLYPTDYYGRWYLGDPTDIVPDENASALIGYNPLADGATRGRVALPKFSTKGLNSATFTLTYLRYGSNASNMYVYVTAWGDEPEKIATLNCSQVTDWRTETFPIPTKFQNREWIQVFIDVDLDDYYFMYAIDSYSFQTGAQVDLAVSDITGDEHVAAFATGNFQVEISNVGFTTVENAQLKLDLADGNEIVATQTKDLGKMEMGTRKTINAEFTPTAQYHGKKLAVNATIVSDADEQPGNNTMSHFFDVIAPDSPVVTDLDASSTDNRIRLWWSRPSQTRPYTESFEEITPFAYQGPMGEFATHDGDQQTVYMFQPSVNPMPNENLPKAFLAVDQTQLLNPTGLEAHSGKMYLMATCPEVTNEKPIPDKADDWLISPQVPGGHAVSFWVNIISEKYPETFEVLASATDNSPQSFTQKLKAATIERTGWQKLSVLLPDNARYFAIHYISHNMFGMMIDDITYPSMKDPYNITGYNIYRDGAKIASTAAETYDDTDVTLGNAYTYTVEALDGTRPYPMSKSYTIVHDNSAIGSAAATTAIIRGTEGAIILTNLAGTTVDIYDTTGRLAATARPESQYETVAIAPGAYIIATHRGIHAKVLVK